MKIENTENEIPQDEYKYTKLVVSITRIKFEKIFEPNILQAIRDLIQNLSKRRSSKNDYLRQMRIKAINATFSYCTKCQNSSFPVFPGFITTSGQLSLKKFFRTESRRANGSAKVLYNLIQFQDKPHPGFTGHILLVVPC